ncbi:MAG: DUF2326 domain-containing protein [Sandaracinaceae bacterium]|nr:DUF2326 domain-containing protein [Sandaracinaceae bacterium]
MIRRVYADLPSFKALSFHDGLNVLLADKSAGATDKQTRNGAGKSSLVELIHFLQGSDCKKDSIFRHQALQESTFGLELDLAGTPTRVERSGSKPSVISVTGDFGAWPVAPSTKGSISNEQWKTVLGRMMFGLTDSEGPYAPSFRSLLSYFVRRDRAGGMADPMKNATLQQLADQQVNVSFLIGLDWTVPREWQRVREREKSLGELKKAMKEGGFGGVVGTASQLKSELIVADDRVKRLEAAVTSFRVVDQYHELEREASRLTVQLGALADDGVLDRRYLAELEAATVEEVPPAAEDLESLFREAGTVLPDLVRRRFKEASAFHESVVRNRRLYLESELAQTRARIQTRDGEKAELDARRAEIMSILRSAGALEHFVALQHELAKAQAVAERLRQQHHDAEALESGQVKLKVERATLSDRLRREYAEQDAVIREAVLTFREVSAQLYEENKAGRLEITPTENGPVFDAHIPAEKSKGVNNMRIFCFDMMLVLLSLRRGRSPGFLVHDSHLFDGVDERQVGTALAVGAALAKKHGFQYLVTMNTDAIPREFPPGFRVEDYALDVKLTDASETGGLFGLRFE